MRILYGVVGEGMGHAVRSRVVLQHLMAAGHEVEVMASGRAVDYLRRELEGGGDSVNAIHGLHMITEDNRIRRWKTLAANVETSTRGLPRNIAAYFELLQKFSPEAIISDFESWTYMFAKSRDLPVLSIDNMQIINRCQLPAEVVSGHAKDFKVAKAFVKAKLPFCRHYFVTSFFTPPVRKERTTLCPPILRDEILRASPTEGEHLLVYQTATGHGALLESLKQTGRPCRIYGMRPDLTEPLVNGNLTFMPFSEMGFIEDLSSAAGVIASAGFTLMGEAVYLGKPMLAVPLEKQFEQILNARYLEHEGYGRMAATLEDGATVRDFVASLPRYRQALQGYHQDGNRALLDALDAQLDAIAAGL